MMTSQVLMRFWAEASSRTSSLPSTSTWVLITRSLRSAGTQNGLVTRPRTRSAVISRALAKNPDERYQTGAQLFKDLENYKALAGGPVATAGSEDRIRP